MLTRLSTAVRRPGGDDSGFTLIEVVVAFVVLAIFASALVIVLVNGMTVSKQARERVAASNLATREVEIVRNRFATSSEDALAVAAEGTVTNQNSLNAPGQPSAIDGVAYTVRRSAQWQPTGTGETACDGGSLVNYPALKISVSVTWPNMGTARPVHAETITTPLKGQLDESDLAFIAVKIQKAAGTTVPGVPVSATGPGGSFSQTSDGSGCAVFQVNTPGSYALSLNSTGWVDQTGVQNPVKTPVVVAAGGLTQAMMTYDQAAAMDISVATTSGYQLPSPLPMVNYTQPNVPVSGSRRTFASAGLTTRVSGLWPQTAGYSAWLGSCSDSDPAGAPTTGSRVPPVVIAPAGVGAITALLAPVDILARSSATAVIPNGVVTATSMAAGGCQAADKTLTLGTTNASGQLKTSVPYGAWKLSITYAPVGTKVATNSTNLQPVASGATAYTLRTY